MAIMNELWYPCWYWQITKFRYHSWIMPGKKGVLGPLILDMM